MDNSETHNKKLATEIHALVDDLVNVPYRITRKPIEQSAEDITPALDTVKDFLEGLVRTAK